MCTFRVDYWAAVGHEYGCFDAKIVDANDAAHVTSISGNHLPGFNSTDVHIFSLDHDNLLKEIPRGIERYFPRLQGIRWEDSNLTSISEATLRYFPKLIALSLWSNNIKNLDSNLFDKTPNLTYIHFSSNNMTKIGHGILDKLGDLTEAYFQSNQCLNFYANSPSELKTLKKKIEDQC